MVKKKENEQKKAEEIKIQKKIEKEQKRLMNGKQKNETNTINKEENYRENDYEIDASMNKSSVAICFSKFYIFQL